MADKTITALTGASTPLAGTEVLPIVQSGSTVKATVANIVGAGTSPGSFTNITGSANAIISVTDNTNAALRITQLGTGNALLVEDSANPDASPFVIDAGGRVAIGSTTATESFNMVSDGRNFFQMTRSSNDVSESIISIRKSKGTSAVPLIVASNDTIGTNQYFGYDGAGYISAAYITAQVDGTPGVNDMPGRLLFATTADGSATPTERMRIGSTGQTTISGNAIISVTDNTNAALRITQLGTGDALLVEDTTNPDATPVVITSGGATIIGYTTPVATQNNAGTALASTQLQQHGVNGSLSSFGVFNWSTSASSASNLIFNKSIGGAAGTRGALTATGTDFGAVSFNGDDGINFIPGASILAETDGTPGVNDMPGRLIFSTTADGAATPTERMRIDSAGIVTMSAYGVGTATFSATGVISSVSDETYKIKDGVIADPIPMVMALETGYYYGKPEANMGDGRQLGFYAQNVRAAIGPEAAPDPETYTVTDEDGVETIKTKPWGYYDRSVLAVAIEAIKVQQAQITALTARIAALEAKCP